jgi:hypothetical protein
MGVGMKNALAVGAARMKIKQAFTNRSVRIGSFQFSASTWYLGSQSVELGHHQFADQDCNAFVPSGGPPAGQSAYDRRGSEAYSEDASGGACRSTGC